MYNLRQLQYVRETIKITRILKRNIIFMCFGFFFALAYLSIHCSKFKSMRMLVQKVVAFQIRSGKKKNEFQAYYEHCTFAFVKKKKWNELREKSEKKVWSWCLKWKYTSLHQTKSFVIFWASEEKSMENAQKRSNSFTFSSLLWMCGNELCVLCIKID